MAKAELEGLATGAGTGAAIGGSVGSVIPVIGTGIGAAAGAVVGGAIGLFSNWGDDEEEEARRRAELEAQTREKDAQKRDAWQQFMISEAAARGANRSLVNRANLDLQYGRIDRGAAAAAQNLAAQHEQERQIDPNTFASLARTGATVSNQAYNQFKTPTPAAPSGTGGGIGGASVTAPTATATINPANLAAIPSPTYTPSKIADPSLSPEVQEGFDTTNLAAIRRGRREGF